MGTVIMGGSLQLQGILDMLTGSHRGGDEQTHYCFIYSSRFITPTKSLFLSVTNICQITVF